MILISACLCGINCKYNGNSNLNEEILKLVREEKVMLICPEQLGGLSTPRKPCEIKGGSGEDVLDGRARVVNNNNEDCTDNFLRGAYEALNIGKRFNAKVAILKAKSPSCGYGKVYDGTFSNNKIDGNGVTTALFLRNNIRVYTEKQLIEFIRDFKK